VKSAAYLRLKNVQIGYTIPKKVIAKTFLNSCRVFFSGQNLFTIDNFYDGFDPEAPIGTGNYYPMVKVYSFGVNVNL
jgi:TonB dependent receptor.